MTAATNGEHMLGGCVDAQAREQADRALAASRQAWQGLRAVHERIDGLHDKVDRILRRLPHAVDLALDEATGRHRLVTASNFPERMRTWASAELARAFGSGSRVALTVLKTAIAGALMHWLSHRLGWP